MKNRKQESKRKEEPQMSKIKHMLALIEDVRAVADDLQNIVDGMECDESDAQETVPEKTIRLEDVRAVLATKSRDGYAAQVRELIARHGSDKLSEVDPAEYAAMLQEAEKIGNVA